MQQSELYACETCDLLARTDGPVIETCPRCGATINRTHVFAAARKTDKQTRRSRLRPVPPPDKQHENFITDVLRFGFQRARVDRAARGGASPLAGMLEHVMLYSFDDAGNRIKGARVDHGAHGTKGVMIGSANDDRDPVHVDQQSQARYDSLHTPDRETVDAVIEDGAGDIPVQRFFGAHGHLLTLGQRVAFLVASITLVETWTAKLAARDPAPALAAAKRLGDQRVQVAANAWWKAF